LGAPAHRQALLEVADDLGVAAPIAEVVHAFEVTADGREAALSVPGFLRVLGNHHSVEPRWPCVK
jgi:hypothetical protein